MKRSTGLRAGFWTTQRLVSHFSESGGHLEPEPSRWALPKPRLGPMKDKPGHNNPGPGHTIRSRRNLESCPAGWTSTPPLLVAPFELTRDTEAARISPMSFSPLELFLLLVAIIGPLKPTVILASAASSSGADPTAFRSVLLIFALQTIIEDPEKAKQEGQGLSLSPNIAIYPLAIPLMSSPAVLILIITLVGESDGFAPLLPLIGMTALIMAVDYVFMRNCLGISRALSPPVTIALGKIVAVMLVGLAVELMFVGLNSWGVVSIEGLKASG